MSHLEAIGSKGFRSAALACIATLGLLTAAAAQAQALRPVTVFLFAPPSGPIVPYFYGVGAGIYKKYGLDVSLRTLGAGTLNGNQLVAQGQGEFAVADATSYLEMRSQGTPIIAIMGAVQGDGTAVVVHKDLNITEPGQLRGHKIAVVNNSGSQNLFPVYLRANGVDPADVDIVALSAAAKNTAFIAKTVDGTVAFGGVTAPLYESQGVPVNVLPYGDKVPYLQFIITTREALTKSDPDLVRRFVQATAEAYVATMSHIPDAAKATVDASNGTAPPQQVLEQQTLGILPYTSTKRDAGKPLGWMAQEDWADTINLSRQYLGLKADPKPADVYTDEFVNTNPSNPEWAYSGK
jgi:NitT/TauT family transport system substrate-binding protein